ncbi:hypothetical protein [Roseibium marinum]|uniref:Uncharacterized protein n=1 Tax=Roseibium marinum TaxID=281252 RepID=A0A2S3V3X6_9HYPH|nr:hypothetical protein [Roseibium marinum]POF34369.1 hypothetical protein CLV41_101824 [Roseibium marinum]
MTSSAKIFAAAYFLGACILMSLGVLLPGGKGLVAVFAKPGGLTAAEVIARADGPVIFVRDGSWVALTESEDHEFIARLYRAGAGFVASSAVAQVCARWNGVLGENTI